MKRLLTGVAVILAILMLGGCGGKGSSASAPAGGLTLVPGDGYVTVSWEMSAGVDYWLYHATTDGASFDPNSCASVPGCGSNSKVSSPYVVSSLLNGVTYSFLMTGRTNGGPGGSPTPVVSAVPRIAGSSWIPNISTDANALRGITQNGTVFVAVGDNGVMFSSTVDSAGWSTWATWARVTNPLPAVNLNAVTYGGSYLAAGAGGAILLSSDATTWTQQASATANDLYALASNGSALYVAVGAGGTIIYSNGGSSWVVANSPTSNALYGVTYGNGEFVAVGAKGTVLTSSDGANWALQAVTANPQLDLKGVAYNGASMFVAVGAAGTLVASADGGATWTSQAPIATGNTLNAVTFGKQFVAVGDNGAIFTSLDGLTWQSQTATPAAFENLYAVKSFTNSYSGVGYAAVGASGRNLSAN